MLAVCASSVPVSGFEIQSPLIICLIMSNHREGVENFEVFLVCVGVVILAIVVLCIKFC